VTAPPEQSLVETLSEDRKDFLHGLFTTALEGGIGYWSACSDYHWSVDGDGTNADVDGFYAVIHPTEDGWGVFGDPKGTVGDCEEDRKPLRIDLGVVWRGAMWMNLYVQGLVDDKGKVVPFNEVKPWKDGHYYWQYVQAFNSNGADGDYDADVADMIVQFGLFGEVVYG
jgi:hypothetical protein